MAANGTDVASCRNADCEILVSGQVTVPLARKFGCTTFVMSYVAPKKVTFSLYCTKTGVVNGYFLGRGRVQLANAVTVEVDKIDGTGAVLHVLPKAGEPGRNNVSGEFGAAMT